ncbi:DUF1828 domain-containing protein [Bradyrhizobium symbiodeficiens]|uniref:DUF1828 domain-containing protein n=1 Tax=Bradyrhizobium symbiodeficiens TaxID=1404367 RepID=UPI0030CF3ED0
MNKEELCKAFCNDLRIQIVPAGLAVTTAFSSSDGDRIGFYVTQQGENIFRIEDDGVTLPYLEGSGVDFRSGTRAEALSELLREYGVRIDESSREFYIGQLAETDVPAAALKFVAFSLRIRDFMLMTEFRVATTFREDAAKLLKEAVEGKAKFEENAIIGPSLADFTADFVLRGPSRPPVAVYLGISDNRILEALFMQMRARYEVEEPVSIVALIEQRRALSSKVLQQAMNRLDAVTEFRGDEIAAVERIARTAIGGSHVRH